jgi:branched-chain amino acid transport system permease protein
VSANPAAKTSRAPGAAFIFKKALISALVALVLFSLMIGIRTEAGPDGQLTYWTRFGDLAAMVAAVFGGSIIIELLRQWWGPVDTVRVVPPSVKSAFSLAGRLIAPVLLVFTFLVPVLFYDERYILDLGILVLTYVMLGWGLNVVVGLAGLLDLGYVAFYAVGAYSYALLATNFGLSFWICLPLAGILAAFWGVLLGFPVLRLRGDYLAIVTLAFGEIIRLVIINWQSLTGGPNGVTGIPRPTLFGIPLTPGDDGLAAMLGIEFSPTHRIVFLFYLILALALLTNWVTIRLRRLICDEGVFSRSPFAERCLRCDDTGRDVKCYDLRRLRHVDSSPSTVTMMCLKAGVLERGSTACGTRTLASGKYIAALPGRMSYSRTRM